MTFDSHVFTLVDVASRLVNELTPGCAAGTRSWPPGASPGSRRWGTRWAATAGVRRTSPPDRPRPSRRTPCRCGWCSRPTEAGDLTEAARVLNRLLDATGARPQLDPLARAGYHVHFHGSTDGLATGWAAGCATGLALAIGTDLAGRLGVCAADRCDRVYVDTSKNASAASARPPARTAPRQRPSGERAVRRRADPARAAAASGPSPVHPHSGDVVTSSSRSGPSVKQCTTSASSVPGSRAPPSWRRRRRSPLLCANGVSSTSGRASASRCHCCSSMARATACAGRNHPGRSRRRARAGRPR